MNRAQGPRNTAQRLRLSHPLGRDDLSLDEPGHEPALGLDEGHDLRADADGPGGERRLVFHLPVDAEELGVLAHDAKHVDLVRPERDLQVVVGDAAAEHLDLRSTARPDPCTACCSAGRPSRARRRPSRRLHSRRRRSVAL